MKVLFSYAATTIVEDMSKDRLFFVNRVVARFQIFRLAYISTIASRDMMSMYAAIGYISHFTL